MSDQRPESRSETEGTQGRSIVHGALAVQVERDGNEAVGHTVPFDGERVRIGAHPSNDVVLRDRHVSRFHVQFLREANGWRVVDYGSMNGTYVNGVQVRDAVLFTGDQLAFDRNRFLIEAPGTPTRPQGMDVQEIGGGKPQVEVTQTLQAIRLDTPHVEPVAAAATEAQAAKQGSPWLLVLVGALIAVGVAALLSFGR